jgi:hypothetical protein
MDSTSIKLRVCSVDLFNFQLMLPHIISLGHHCSLEALETSLVLRYR